MSAPQPCNRHTPHSGAQCEAQGVPLDPDRAISLCYLAPHHDGPHWDSWDGHWLVGEHAHVVPLPACEVTA